jgi:SpoVK/Ycf46/Vps4 family AAA+-type ATPase
MTFFLLCEKALCTKAALNAIQRKYPQVHQTNDSLLLKPKTIGVGRRDFMISIKNKVLFFDS